MINKGSKFYFDESNRLDSVRIDDYRRYAYYYDYAGRRVKKLYITGNRCDSTEWSINNSNQHCDHGASKCWFVPGDVNNDSKVAQSDVTYLSNYLSGGSAPPYPIFRGDVNCSGTINSADVTYLNNYLNASPSLAPKCCYWLRTDTVTTYYVYSGDQLIAEYDGSGSVLDKYAYGGGLNPVVKFNSTYKRFYVHDIRGSVVAVLNSTGSSVLTSYDYYPFGQVLSVSGSDDRHKYVGKELDEGYDVDLYYFGARYYDAALGRFISPDPIRWYFNPYSYCANDPIQFIDKNGLDGTGIISRALDADAQRKRMEISSGILASAGSIANGDADLDNTIKQGQNLGKDNAETAGEIGENGNGTHDHAMVGEVIIAIIVLLLGP